MGSQLALFIPSDWDCLRCCRAFQRPLSGADKGGCGKGKVAAEERGVLGASAKGLLQEAHTTEVELEGDVEGGGPGCREGPKREAGTGEAAAGGEPGTIKVEGEGGLRWVKVSLEATPEVAAGPGALVARC